jgi:hypothetical protein
LQAHINDKNNPHNVTAEQIKALKVYNRDNIGTSPNYDDPGVNGFFEIRSTTETPGETGTRPPTQFIGCLNLKTPDNVAMMQLCGSSASGFFIRGK